MFADTVNLPIVYSRRGPACSLMLRTCRSIFNAVDLQREFAEAVDLLALKGSAYFILICLMLCGGQCLQVLFGLL